MDVLNNITAPDKAPTAASTIDGAVPCSRAVVDVQNSAIYWQAKCGNGPAEAAWTPANGVFMAPGSRRAPVPGKVYGFRFWAAVPAASLASGAKQAQVTVTLT